ncbi:hypothetical protein CI610_02370 [invertebrate metagenome]|uniref:Non-specific serine/threonine protein kinase n=1 Tax=invertebrate metagenome TaxID=1711999 RepID=A0A2H9T634_9ZZZZ
MMITSSQWTVTEDYKQSSVARAFSSLDQVFSLQGERIASDSLTEIIRIKIGDSRYYVKRYKKGSEGGGWLLGRSRIHSEWKNLLYFNTLGLPTAPVVAYGAERFLHITGRGCLVTEEVKESEDMAALAHRGFFQRQPASWKKQVIQQVANITRTLHKHRFIHLDLKWRNLLLTNDNNIPEVVIIDCPSGSKQPCFFPKNIMERMRIKDLACLDKVAKYTLSKTDRLFFYKLYAGCLILNEQDKLRIKRILSFFEGRE